MGLAVILRTYGCETCAHMMTVELRSDQWDQQPPECPQCSNTTHQEFAPPAIGGSLFAKAAKLAEDIVEKDYGIADFKSDGRIEGRPKVRYKDASPGTSTWGMHSEALSQAVALGRETRIKHGNGLDILQANLKSGAQPDLIELSKKRSMRVW